MSAESSKALKALATSIKTMTDPSPAASHVEAAKDAVNHLKSALRDPASMKNITLDLPAIVPAATVASILIEIVYCVEQITESVNELSDAAHFKKKVETTVSPETGKHLLHRGTVNPVFDGDGGSNHVVITIHESNDVVASDSAEENSSKAPVFGQRRVQV